MKKDIKQITETNKLVSKREIKEYKNRILKVFSNYKLQVNSISVLTGTAISLYQVNLKPGIRVTKIKNFQDDIILSLAVGARIIIPRPYKDSIGIELPNKNPNKVSYKSITTSKEFLETEMQLPLAIGETIPNKPFIIDLIEARNILIAGSESQEISNIINVILASLLYKQHPSQIKFVLFDSKNKELSTYSKVEKHYLAKLNNYDKAIISDIKKGEDVLETIVIEMENRFNLLNKTKTRNIKEYNKLIEQKLNTDTENIVLPYLVVVINDYADLIMFADNNRIEISVARIAQQANVVGIHLIIATQQPSTNVITGIIKANIATRISFKTENNIESRTIIDETGAQELIGEGDMLINNGNITRVQSAEINSNEIEDILEYISKQEVNTNVFKLPNSNISTSHI